MRRSLLFVAASAVCLAVSAQTASPVTFGATAEDTFIGKQTGILEDPDGLMDIRAALTSKSFQVSDQDVPNLAISSAAHWLRFDLTNASQEPVLLLTLPYSEIEELDVYMARSGATTLIGHTGQARALGDRVGSDPEFVFEIPLPPNERCEVLLRIRGTKQIHVPLKVMAPGAFSQTRARRNLLLGAYVGIMMVMALYNLFVFVSIRDRSYLFYVLYILVICATQLSVLGIGQAYLWLGLPWLSSSSSIILVLGSILLGVQFARRFMDMRSYTPRLNRITPLFFILSTIILMVYLFADASTGYKMTQGLSGLSALFLLTVAVIALRQGSRQAGFFLLAWAAFLIAVVVFVMKDAGALPYNDFTTAAMPVGSAIEGVLLSFGLADRINILRREKERSQEEALQASLENERIIREQNAMLEVKVTERTHALQESNDHLKRTQTQLVNAEKMASLGQLTAGIAHEINNPVNFITSNIPPLRRNLGEMLEVLNDYRKAGSTADAEALKAVAVKEKKLGLDESIEELGDILGSIEEGAGRTAEIVRGLRNFSRLDEDDLKPADINECLRSTLTVLGPQYREHVEVDLQLGSIPRVECFAGKLNQVFMNMLNNASQAVKAHHPKGGGRVTIATAEREGQLVVTIRDNGLGMTDAVKARIYEPFFTTKDVGEGTGLGLSIAYSIVEKHHGTIEVDSVPGEGSEFRVVLPLEQPQLNARRA